MSSPREGHYRVEAHLGGDDVVPGDGGADHRPVGQGLRRPDVIQALPLVDEERLVAVHEPGEVLQPLQPDGDGAVLEEESPEQHEGDEDRGTDGESNVDAGRSTGDHVT